MDERARDGYQAGLATLVLLSLGHSTVDLYSGALGALQPVLLAHLGLSLADVGILGGVFVVASSLAQPAYGYLSDRIHTRLFAALGPAVAGICISFLGLAPTFGWLLALAALGASGVAAFHPQASSAVAFGTERNRGTWMAVFVTAGTLGYSLGPVYFSKMLEWLGLARMYWAAAPGILVSAFLLVRLPSSPRRISRRRGGFRASSLLVWWRPLSVLYLLVVFRSVLQVVFAQFLPLYLHLERGFSVPNANYALTAYLAAGALGGFLGGRLADRVGGRLVTQLSMAGCVPFLLLFFFGSGTPALLGLVLGGLILFLTLPVNVVMAQELVPSQAGTVSALMMGFAWGTAGMIFIPLTGWAADLFSLHQVLETLLVFPVAGFALAFRLKKK